MADSRFYTWRKSFWAKGIAVCFILLILIGNIWFVQAFVSKEPPIWLQWLFFANLLLLFSFGSGLFLRQLIFFFGKADDNDSEV